MSLTDKCNVVGYFVCGYCNKFLMEKGTFSDKPGSQKGLVSGVYRVLMSSNSTFKNVGDRLDPIGKSVDFDFLFPSPSFGILLTCVHDNPKYLVP